MLGKGPPEPQSGLPGKGGRRGLAPFSTPSAQNSRCLNGCGRENTPNRDVAFPAKRILPITCVCLIRVLEFLFRCVFAVWSVGQCCSSRRAFRWHAEKI